MKGQILILIPSCPKLAKTFVLRSSKMAISKISKSGGWGENVSNCEKTTGPKVLGFEIPTLEIA